MTLGAIRVFDGTDWSSSLTTGGVTGSGTTNYLARWTPSGSALGNSVVQDDGTQVHVGGTPTSSTMLKVTPVDKYGIYVDSDQNTSSVISAYIADIANTGTGNIEAIYSTSAGSNDASANVSLFHSNGVTAGTQANSYGLYLTAHTAGTAKWGVYQAGANDKNYFAGAMQFDTAAAATGYVWTATDANGNGDWSAPTESLIIAASDETTALTTGTAKITFRMPYAFTLTGVRASLTTAGTTSGTTTVDINEAGVSILSTKLTIDFSEKTSTTAATAAVISDSALADDAEITVDIDAISGGATEAGLKIYLIGNRA